MEDGEDEDRCGCSGIQWAVSLDAGPVENAADNELGQKTDPKTDAFFVGALEPEVAMRAKPPNNRLCKERQLQAGEFMAAVATGATLRATTAKASTTCK